ncbi:MAG: hypothetical protein HY287_05905 [Planctomycetes bacterium]|nr:hypothetical protein [Planctomycetota bacterium]MBI3833846.1 hypothetical protein [Planctomycetota bacterium]
MHFGFLILVTSEVYLFTTRTVVAKPPANSGAERLVTGDAARLGSVANTASATLFFWFSPSPPLNGNHPSLAYPPGFTFLGPLIVSSGYPFTSAWRVYMGNWDTSGQGNIRLSAFQDLIDQNGLLGANASPPSPGCDLVFNGNGWAACHKTCAGGAQDGIPCDTDAKCQGGGICTDPCPAILGENGPKCGTWTGGFCDSYWVNDLQQDWVLAGLPPSERDSGPMPPNLGAPGFMGTATFGHEVVDPGSLRYVGTATVQVPECCLGTYTIGHVAAETFARDQAQPANNIPIAALTAGQISCRKGKCCTPTQCIDDLTASGCAAAGGENGPPSFIISQTCTNPPTTDGCCECSIPSDCNDNDRCTVDICGCQCSHERRSGWNSNRCCNPDTGAVATKAIADGPCVRGCSLPGDYGVPQIVYSPAGTPCPSGTGNQCLENEVCDDTGHCTGTPKPMGTPCILTDLCISDVSCDGAGHCLGTASPQGTPCTLSGAPDPCITSYACDGQKHCIAQQDLGPQCLKNRYITFLPQDTGGLSALRVTLNSLQHPQPPNDPAFHPQNFSAFEGQFRWVGPLQDCEESELPPSSFKCAILQCTPLYADWASQLSGEWLQVMGVEVMPSSTYTIEQLNASCQGNEQACSDVVTSALLRTARYGDCVPTYQDPSASSSSQPNVSDVSHIVDKFKAVPGAISRTRAQMQPGVIAVGLRVTIADVAVTLDAFKGLAYAQPGPQNCP